jgi:hypothetical protein
MANLCVFLQSIPSLSLTLRQKILSDCTRIKSLEMGAEGKLKTQFDLKWCLGKAKTYFEIPSDGLLFSDKEGTLVSNIGIILSDG